VNVSAYGGDPERIIISGHSAGAYNAVMLASDPSYLTTQGLGLSAIRGVIGIAGPYNFLPLNDDNLIDMFGGTDRTETQPIFSVDGERPPMLLVTGSEDDTVSPRNVSTMAAHLREFNSPVQTITYDGEGHMGIILSLYWPFKKRNSLRDDMLQFVRTK
jgi:acetyl esterase/lipase